MLVIIIVLLLCSPVFAQSTNVNENDLFSDENSIVETSKIVNNTPPEEEKKSIGISGELTSVFDFSGTRDWVYKKDDKNNSFTSYVLNNLLLDIRLKQGMKGFANLETLYLSQNATTNVVLRELFLDFNLNNIVYFRTGKQVLQWGRCYLWNPTDLINVEKKLFIQKIGYREGAYGIKMHVPFGTVANVYGFIDTGSAQKPENIAGAGKLEFLLGKTEMAVAAWAKKDYEPVYTYDFSTRILGIDTVGELAMSYGDNYNTMKVDNGVLSTDKTKSQWIPRASIGVGRAFDFMDVNDRVSVHAEMYYNQTGYSNNVLNDTNFYTAILSTVAPFIPVPITKKGYIFLNNLYEMNNFSKYYAAFFVSVSKFIISDMSLTFNVMSNLVDYSGIVSLGLNYQNMNDFSWGLGLYSFIGPDNCEYTLSGNALTARCTAGIRF